MHRRGISNITLTIKRLVIIFSLPRAVIVGQHKQQIYFSFCKILTLLRPAVLLRTMYCCNVDLDFGFGYCETKSMLRTNTVEQQSYQHQQPRLPVTVTVKFVQAFKMTCFHDEQPKDSN